MGDTQIRKIKIIKRPFFVPSNIKFIRIQQEKLKDWYVTQSSTDLTLSQIQIIMLKCDIFMAKKNGKYS